MMWLQLIIIIALLFFLYLMIFRYKVPWVPIWQRDLKRLPELLFFEDGKTFYDLGCGNGRVIFYLARKYPQVNFVGIELSVGLYLLCQLRKIFGRYKNVKIKWADYMKLDYNQTDYLYVFANQKPMQEIGQKVINEVNNNLVLISYCFGVDNWDKHLLKHDKPDEKTNSIYVYEYKNF